MKASDLLVRCLEQEGVRWIFGIPGEENLDFLESLHDSPIELVLTRHEQGAGFMAATVGRLTGKAGVCLATLGPGATNLVTPAAYAQLGAMPLFLLTGQKPIRHSKQGKFQIIDVVDMLTPVTKFTDQVVGADLIPSLVRETFRMAEEERPGACHLELPEDIATDTSKQLPVTESNVRRPMVDEKSLDTVVSLLTNARHPIVVVAGGANRKRTSRMLRAFVDKLAIPFVSTQMGKGVIDETSPLFLGNAALSEGDFLHRAIQNADLILNVGHDVVEKPPFMMKDGQPEVVHINFSSASVDPVYFPQTELVGDIANTIWQLTERVEANSCWDFTFFDKAREAFDKHLQQGIQDPSFPVSPRRLVADIRRAIPANGIIALDNGIYKIWFARNYRAVKPNSVLLDNALASMGAGLPSAIAAKMVYPDRRVMAICGDGGFMMNSQEIETAVRLKLDLIVLILSDDGYGMIKWKQQQMKFADYGLDFKNPCFKTYAEAYGASGHVLEETDKLVGLINECFQQGGVHLIDVPVDYSRNVELLNEQLPELSASL